ncbi:hypothetical protein CesoFtcFv8_023599 [Champsocephalus esox]|uniref:Uncharacterized protein n=1 Tax=Champsocephalus esox TaxID=159716 RepID=A0AAN8B9G6_9TELE|nr:hypothetical protein CesoFtcFv8_023599 [Champsocephalus esox]
MKDLQQTVGEVMKERVVPVWNSQTAQSHTGFLFCSEPEGTRGQNLPSDQQGSDKTAACRQQAAGRPPHYSSS